jgi:hypothetical protein
MHVLTLFLIILGYAWKLLLPSPVFLIAVRCGASRLIQPFSFLFSLIF